MSATQNSPNMGKSLGAIFAGFVAVVVLSIGTDLGLHAAGIAPALGQRMSDGLLLFAATYRSLYGVLGSYITARLAPNRPMVHALVGGVVGLVLSIVGAVMAWNKVSTMGPHWYPLALVATAMPGAWLGGKLRVMQLLAGAEA